MNLDVPFTWPFGRLGDATCCLLLEAAAFSTSDPETLRWLYPLGDWPCLMLIFNAQLFMATIFQGWCQCCCCWTWMRHLQCLFLWTLFQLGYPLLLYACLPLKRVRTSKLLLGHISCRMERNWSSSDAYGGEDDFFDTLNLRRRQASLFECMSSNILCRISARESNVPLGFIDSRGLNSFDEKPPVRKLFPSILFDSCL